MRYMGQSETRFENRRLFGREPRLKPRRLEEADKQCLLHLSGKRRIRRRHILRIQAFHMFFFGTSLETSKSQWKIPPGGVMNE